jgi:hypothetical protein
MTGTKMTRRRLEAIEDGLRERLAGAIEGGDLERADYEAALRWVDEQLAKRPNKRRSHAATDIRSR